MMRVCRCPQCTTESVNIKDKIAFELGGEAFDCPNCGEKFAIPKNSPSIYEVEDDFYRNFLRGKVVSAEEIISNIKVLIRREKDVNKFADVLIDIIHAHAYNVGKSK